MVLLLRNRLRFLRGGALLFCLLLPAEPFQALLQLPLQPSQFRILQYGTAHFVLEERQARGKLLFLIFQPLNQKLQVGILPRKGGNTGAEFLQRGDVRCRRRVRMLASLAPIFLCLLLQRSKSILQMVAAQEEVLYPVLVVLRKLCKRVNLPQFVRVGPVSKDARGISFSLGVVLLRRAARYFPFLLLPHILPRVKEPAGKIGCNFLCCFRWGSDICCNKGRGAE